MISMRGKQHRVAWVNPDTARRRAATARHLREWVVALATFYAAFGPKIHG